MDSIDRKIKTNTIDKIVKEVGNKFINLSDETIIYNHHVADCYHTDPNGYSFYVCTVGEYKEQFNKKAGI